MSLQKKDDLKSLVNPNLEMHSISSPASQSTSPNSNSSSLSEYEVCSNHSSTGATCGGRSAFSPFNKHQQHHSFQPYVSQHHHFQQQNQLSSLIEQSSHLQKQRELETLTQLLQSQLYQNQQHQQQLQMLASGRNGAFYLPNSSGIQHSSSIENLRNMNLDDNLYESSNSNNNLIRTNNSTSTSNHLVNPMLMNKLLNAKSNVLCAPVLLPVNQYNNQYNLPYCIVPLLSNAYP